jgi:hypothetical protein
MGSIDGSEMPIQRDRIMQDGSLTNPLRDSLGSLVSERNVQVSSSYRPNDSELGQTKGTLR